MIELTNIELSFGKRQLIEKGDTCIPYQQVTLLRGESGSGKTSLLMDIGLLAHQAKMNYLFDGIDINTCHEKQRSYLRQNEISFIFQENYLFEHLNLIENIYFYAHLIHRQISEEEIREYLDFVDLDLDFQTSLKSMSGGERQRLAIVCGIVKDAKLFIFDEPTSYLDNENKQKIISINQNLAYQKGKMVLVASHDDAFVEIADQIYEIKDMNLSACQISEYQIESKPFQDYSINQKVLYQYSLKKSKVYGMVAGIVLGLVLMGFALSLIYGTLLKENDEKNLLLSIHHYGIVLKEDEKPFSVTEQTRLKQALPDLSIYPYAIMTSSLQSTHQKLNSITIKPYYEKMITDNDILKKKHELSSSDIYATYEIYHYLKDDVFSHLISEGQLFDQVDAVLKPNYDHEQAIYLPYDMIEGYYQQQGIELSNTPTPWLVVSINSISDYQMASQNIEPSYQFLTTPDINSQVRLSQVFGSQYLIVAWIIILVVLFVYNTYRVIEDKRNIALLETLGVNYYQLMKMKALEELILLTIMGGSALLLSVIMSFFLTLMTMENLLLICLVIIMNMLFIFVMDMLIFIVFVKRYSVSLLFRND